MKIILLALGLAASLSLSGCGEPTPPPGTPAGMVSASGHIDNGTVLYNKDGSEFGTVIDFSESHQFPTGTDRGVEVRYSSGETVWLLRSFVMNNKYVRG